MTGRAKRCAQVESGVHPCHSRRHPQDSCNNTLWQPTTHYDSLQHTAMLAGPPNLYEEPKPRRKAAPVDIERGVERLERRVAEMREALQQQHIKLYEMQNRARQLKEQETKAS